MSKLKIVVLYDRVLVDEAEETATADKSPVVRTLVSTRPASVSMATAVVSPARGTMPVSTAAVAAPIVASPHDT